MLVNYRFGLIKNLLPLPGHTVVYRINVGKGIMKDEKNRRGFWGFTKPTPGSVALTARRSALVLGLAYAVGASAQTNNNFNVTVNPSQSQKLVVTQGQTTLEGAAVTLRTLERISAFSRARLLSSRVKKKAQQKTAGRNIMLAALGNTLYSVLADDEQPPEVDLGFLSRMGTFSDITYGFGRHGSTSKTPSYDRDIFSITAGVDYRLTPTTVIGGSVAYRDSGNDFSGGVGSLDVKAYSIAGFGSWYWAENGYVDGILRYARNDYDTRRRDTTGAVATGNPYGDEFSLSFGGGYDYTLRGWTAGPTARLKYVNVSIDGYRERGSSEALVYKSQSVKSLNTNIGGQVSRAINTNFGVVLPQGNLEWVHEFEDDGRSITARPAAGGAAFLVPVDARDSNFMRLSLGTSLLFANGRMLYLRYEGEFAREDVTHNTLSLGARLEF